MCLGKRHLEVRKGIRRKRRTLLEVGEVNLEKWKVSRRTPGHKFLERDKRDFLILQEGHETLV